MSTVHRTPAWCTAVDTQHQVVGTVAVTMSAVRRALSVFRPDLFDGRVAIVTGGATGIGRAIAAELAQLSCKVVIASRNAERLTAAAEELSAADGVKHEVQSVVCNIRNPDEVSVARAHHRAAAVLRHR